MKNKQTPEDVTKIHDKFDRLYKKFIVLNNLLDFTFSIDTFEICVNVFDEINIENLDSFNSKLYRYNSFYFDKLCFLLKIPNTYLNCKNIYKMYLINLNLLHGVSDNCLFYSVGAVGLNVLDKEEIREFKRQGKYGFEKLKNTGSVSYVYEFNCIQFHKMNLLLFFNSCRKELIDHGDTVENIKNTDFTIAIHKYFYYLTKGVAYYDGQGTAEKYEKQQQKQK